MCEGRITGELIGDEIDQNKIMQYAIKGISITEALIMTRTSDKPSKNKR